MSPSSQLKRKEEVGRATKFFEVTKEAWAALDEALAQAGDDKDARRKAWEAWEPYKVVAILSVSEGQWRARGEEERGEGDE